MSKIKDVKEYFCLKEGVRNLANESSDEKANELFHLLKFRRAIKHFPEGEIVLPPAQNTDGSSNPDFIIGDDIGIEHTRIFRDSDMKGYNLHLHEIKAREIVRRAQKVYDSKNSVPLRVGISFMNPHGLDVDYPGLKDVDKQQMKEIAAHIAFVVGDNIPQEYERVQIEGWSQQEQIIRDKIKQIRIYNHPKVKESMWQAGDGAFLPELTSEKINEVLKNKEDKYRKDLKEIWLLIIEGSELLAALFDIEKSENALNAEYESTFDRVFLFRNASEAYFELNV